MTKTKSKKHRARGWRFTAAHLRRVLDEMESPDALQEAHTRGVIEALEACATELEQDAGVRHVS